MTVQCGHMGQAATLAALGRADLEPRHRHCATKRDDPPCSARPGTYLVHTIFQVSAVSQASRKLTVGPLVLVHPAHGM